MKALTDRLEWVRLYLVDPTFSQDAAFKQEVLYDLLAAIAIAEALPEITIVVPAGMELSPVKRLPPPARIIDLPRGS